MLVLLSQARAQERISFPIHWSGYTQNRVTSDFQHEGSFEIRRAKLWIDGRAPFEGNWYYKVQNIFNVKQEGALMLQDVFAEYSTPNWKLRLGQVVPDFSLQRSQPDYIIPVVERGSIVSNMIPSAETGARDIGALLKFVHTSI